MSALEAAIAARHPGAMLIDQHEGAGYCVLAGMPGLQRVRFSTLPSGGIQLLPPERMALRSKVIKEGTPTIMPRSQPSADYAPPPETPTAWGGAGPSPVVHQGPAALPEIGARLHMMAAAGSDQDFAPIAAGPWDQARPASNLDFAPICEPKWS